MIGKSRQHGGTFSSLDMSDMAKQIPYDIEVRRYTGPKKPTPPERSAKVQVPTPANLAQTAALLNRAREGDLEFFKNIHNGGLNIAGTTQRKLGKKGNHLKRKTRAIYLPLIDMPPYRI